MLITNAAMIAFAAEPELCRVRAPALVLGGTTDPYYSEDLFRRTAAAIPGGRAVIFPGKGHLYPAASKAAANIALDSCSDGSQIFYAPAAAEECIAGARSWCRLPRPMGLIDGGLRP